MIVRRDINIVDVEHQATVGLFNDASDEFPFGHGALGVRQIAGGVFQAKGDFEVVLDHSRSLSHTHYCFFSVGKR